jgi:hypothetical protein
MLATELDFRTDWNAPPKNKKTKLYKSDTVPSEPQWSVCKKIKLYKSDRGSKKILKLPY